MKELFWSFVLVYNNKSSELLNVVWLLLDESMSAWKPNTSITFDSRWSRWIKRLRKNILNSAECQTGPWCFMIVCKWQKHNQKRRSTFQLQPQGGNPSAHCSHVKSVKSWWVGSGVWFLSIPIVVELNISWEFLSIHLEPYLAVLFNASFEYHTSLLSSKKTCQTFVIMKATVAQVNLIFIIITYTWSDNGLTYIFSSCETTTRHHINSISKFEVPQSNVY